MTACLSVRQFPDKSDAFPAAAMKEKEKRVATDSLLGQIFQRQPCPTPSVSSQEQIFVGGDDLTCLMNSFE